MGGIFPRLDQRLDMAFPLVSVLPSLPALDPDSALHRPEAVDNAPTIMVGVLHRP